MRGLSVSTVRILIPVAILASGCVDLALEPNDAVSHGAYFQSIRDFRAAAIGLHDQMQSAAWYGRTIPLLADIMGEDVKRYSALGRFAYGLDFAEFGGHSVSGHGTEYELWSAVYAGINMANMMINAPFEPLPGVKTELDHLIGEAHAVRALAHFDLVKTYAQHYTFTADASHPGIPIVLESDMKHRPRRNTVAEVYDQVISDFTMAIGLMNLGRPEPFMISKEAAQALLSRVYLYKEDFPNAVAMADAVINGGNFSLVGGESLAKMFQTGGTAEAILEVNNTPSDNQGSNSLGGMYRDTGYGDCLPAKDLLNLLDPADSRWGWFKEDSLLFGIYAGHRVDKWPTPTGTDNIPVIRLAEVYLNRAEANARLGNDGLAQDDLNRIRQRALPTAPNVTATGQALIDEILLERRIELSYEGHRLHDLTRHRLDVERDDCTGDVCFYAYPGPYLVLPIPQLEMDANPNIEQNPGYGSWGG